MYEIHLLTAAERLIKLQRVAEQLQQTDALLNKYINIMAKSEDMINLIFDERWHGADKASLKLFVKVH